MTLTTGRIEIPGLFNLRDVGGHPTLAGERIATGRLFRSDGLHKLEPGGLDRLAGLGIGRAIDLRGDRERTVEGALTAPGIRVDRAPIEEDEMLGRLLDGETIDGDLLLTLYRSMVAANTDRLAEAIGLVAAGVEAGEPTVVFCTAGKDRTGVVVALILAGLGVDDEYVVADYARSAAPMADLADDYTRRGYDRQAELVERGVAAGVVEQLSLADEATMAVLLAELREANGSICRFLGSIGAGEPLAALRHSLLG